jgi:hypothetical protein
LSVFKMPILDMKNISHEGVQHNYNRWFQQFWCAGLGPAGQNRQARTTGPKLPGRMFTSIAWVRGCYCVLRGS